MKNILFLCTGNSCRSQMAEGFGHFYHSDKFNFYSAGIKKHGINPYAVKVMSEVGIDISKQESNLTSELAHIKLDLVITVCAHAHESCPYISHEKIVHIGFDDPPTLANNLSDEEEILEIYRRVRDEIKEMVKDIEKVERAV